MTHELRRTLSFSDIGRTSAEPTAPIYRNPDRDADERSLIDRTSENTSVRYESEPKAEQRRELPNPRRDNLNLQMATLTVKPNKVAVFITPFDGTNDRETIQDWFAKFDIMAETNAWPEEYKKNMLLFNLEQEPYRYCFELKTENKDITYDEMKRKIVDRFTNYFNTPITFHNLTNRKLKRGEPFLSYWADKVELMRRFDPKMSLISKMNHVIDGLDADLYREVLKSNQMNPPITMDDLFHKINSLYQIEQSTRSQRELSRKSVRFEEPPQNQRFDRRDNRFGFGNSRAFHPNRPENRNNYQNRSNWRDGNQRYSDNPRNYSRDNQRGFNNAANRGNARNFATNSNRNVDDRIRGRPNDKPTSNSDDNKNRYTRSPEGAPICFNCGKAGHVQYSCPEKKKEKRQSEN